MGGYNMITTCSTPFGIYFRFFARKRHHSLRIGIEANTARRAAVYVPETIETRCCESDDRHRLAAQCKYPQELQHSFVSASRDELATRGCAWIDGHADEMPARVVRRVHVDATGED